MRAWSTASSLFQYHTGSIKSRLSGFGFARGSGFNTTLVQLKVRATPKAERPKYVSFNTTLVQLKVTTTLSSRRSLLARFNTTLVQLKVLANPAKFKLPERFQYHTGSIKSAHKAFCEIVQHPRFNTTLVQLKEFQIEGEQARNIGFNTTLVQLKVSGLTGPTAR